MKSSQLAPKLIARFIKLKARKPTPFFVSYNVTGRCNLKCVFCDWWKKSIPELSTKQALKAIDAVCSLGVPFFDLSGGEPLLRKDLFVLARRVASHGCLVSMNTNGTLLDENTVLEVAKVFDTVVVSLDGPKVVHEKIRGVPGAYSKAVKAIKLLRVHGIRTGVNSVVTPWNVDILPQFIEDLRGIVDFAQIQPMHPYPPLPANVPMDEGVSFLVDYLLKLKGIDPGFLAVPEEFIRGFEQFFKGQSPKICDAGELYIAINPEGKLLACPARSDLVLGDTLRNRADELLKDRNSEGWHQVALCKGCWLECTVGVSMLLKNPLKEASQLLGLWQSGKS